MSYTRLILVTDADIGNVEPEATHSTRPWGAATWPEARAEAKRDLKIWIERDFGKVNGRYYPGVSDRLLDRWAPDWAFRYTAAAFTDISVALRDDNEEDVDVAAALATAGSDRIYIGALWEFSGVAIKLLDSVNAAQSVLTAKYWAPTGGWVTLSAADGTAVGGATLAQSGRVSWTVPPNWERRRLNGTAEEFFWVELSVSGALTAGTAATQILPVRAPDGLKRVACYLALGHIFDGLAAAAATPEAWRVRATNKDRTGYRDMAEDLYASLRDAGGIAIDLNLNEAVDKPEQQVSAPLRLRRG